MKKLISALFKRRGPFLFLLLLIIFHRGTDGERALSAADVPAHTPARGATPARDTIPARGAAPLFFQGEKLVYEVHFLGVSAGEAQLIVKDPIIFSGRQVFPLLSTVQSNDFVSFIYPVRDRVESYLDAEGLYSHRIHVDQHQGTRKRKKDVLFDHVQHKAIQTKDNVRLVFDIPPHVNDFLSVLYYFRAQAMPVIGRSVFFDVHEGGKNWKLEIRPLNKETVITPMGTFATIKTQAMPRFEGIFLDKADLYIWITDDDRRIPVKIQSRIKVGTITISLISREAG